MSLSSMYTETVENLISAVESGSDSESVPSSPGWTYREVMAHVTGIVDDMLNGRIEGMGSDPWTELQVSKRADDSTETIAAEWRGLVPQIPWDFIGEAGGLALLQDLVVHLCDVRSGRGQAPILDDAFFAALDFDMERLRRRAEKVEDFPSVEVTAGDRNYSLGSGTEPVTLNAEPFELFRTVTGRRTREQAAQLDWSATPGEWLDHFHLYPWADRPGVDPV